MICIHVHAYMYMHTYVCCNGLHESTCVTMCLFQDMVKERAAPVYTKKKIPPVTDSFHNLMVRRVLQDFSASVVQVSDTSLANE